ncbi:hypothetical protein V3N95_07635 [Micrococcaceae bacterium Sec6.3]
MTEPQIPADAPAVLPDPSHLLEGVFVVLVAHQVPGELRTRRRVFFNLPAAQRAADRATMRGQSAAVTLCRLEPVHTFAGGWSS